VALPLLTIQIEDVNSLDALGLIEQLSRELADIYPDERKGGAGFRPADMDEAGSAFVVLRLDGLAVGCGAIRPFEGQDVAEVKRMFVQPAHRGIGLSRHILTKLEEVARAFGYCALILETGDKQIEAMRLYEKSGFAQCDCWGEYLHSGWSVCYRKELA
jgi:putative acetyltransferase